MIEAVLQKRDALIVSRYRQGLTLREVAALFGMTMQRVHQIIQRDAPQLMRPAHVAPLRRRRRPEPKPEFSLSCLSG